MATQIYSKPITKYPPNFQTLFSLYIYYSFVLFLQILISVPIAIFRFFVIIYIKTLVKNRKDYGSILNSFGTLFADDQFTTNPTNYSIVTVLELEGKLTLNKLKSVMKETLELKLEGSKRYAKLCQYPKSVMGYWFWKNEPNFDLDEHLHVVQFKDLVDNTIVGISTIENLHTQFLNKTFPKFKSPWYITLIENVPQKNKDSPKTLLLLKIHHSLADGISTLKLIVEGLGQTTAKTSESSQPPTEKSSFFNRLNSYVNILIYLFPNLLKSAVDAHLSQQMTLNHPWRYNIDKSNKSVPSFPTFSKEIPVEMLKIKCDQPTANKSISPSAVIITAVTQSVHKFFKNCDTFFLPVVLPKPMHPKFPINHFNLGTVTMPNFGGNIFDAIKHADTLYLSQRDDHVHHLTNKLINSLLTILPKPLRLRIQPFWPYVSTLSNIAGNNVEFSIADLPCQHFSLSVSPANSALGVGFTVFSYKKLVRFCVIAKENILTKEEGQYLVDLISQQISNMNKLSRNHKYTSSRAG